MVRILCAEFLHDGSGKKYIEMAGLSTDSKPVNDLFATGSLFLEVDTGDLYAFDEETNDGEWDKIAALGGGS